MQGMTGMWGGVDSNLVAGAAGVSYDPLGYVDDVASWGIYTGDGNTSAPTIYTGVDFTSTDYSLSGGSLWCNHVEGGGNSDWGLYDTVRGQVQADRYKLIQTNYKNATVTHAQFHCGAFTSSGFKVSDSSECNANGGQYAFRQFRRRAKFHDIVRYTGNGSNQAISHSLGTKPGFIIVKNDDSNSTNFVCYHSHLNGGSSPEDYYIQYNNGNSGADPNAESNSASHWNDTAPTSTHFTVGSSGDVNSNGDEYMAWIFAGAEDDGGYGENSDESIIKTGEYTGALDKDTVVDVGFEPGMLWIKRRDNSGHWLMIDDTSMWPSKPGSNSQDSNYERAGCNWGRYIESSSNYSFCAPITKASGVKGFTHLGSVGNDWNASGGKYIYVAVRKLGQRPAATASTSGTDLFLTAADSGDNGGSKQDPLFDSDFKVDIAWAGQYNGGDKYFWSQRIGNQNYFYPFASGAMSNHFTYEYNFVKGFCETTQNFNSWEANMFARRKKFFTSQVYVGNGSNQAIPHDLGTTPGVIMIKMADGSGYMMCKLNNTNEAFYMTNAAQATGTNWWNDTAATATEFTVGSEDAVNESGKIFYAYLWGDQCVKCGTYTGNTSSGVTVSDVGFQPRGLMIRRTNAGENWIWINHARGMTSGYQYLSSQAAYSTSYSLNAVNANGFTISSGTTNTHINHNGSTYFYMAIK